MVYSLEQPARTKQGVMEVLIRAQHLSPIQFRCVEQVEIDFRDRALPAGAVGRPCPLVVVQEALATGVAVVVEGNVAVRHIDMVSGKTLSRDDPFCVKSLQRRMLEEGTGENGARAVTEKDAVRQRPSLFGVSLYAMFQDVHAALIPMASCDDRFRMVRSARVPLQVP
ncbi:hypothetical protein [Mesorhizobium sp. ES1-4]|uniref:hypothetical protein n=1 Tax=Mesorhizobium sp. ES1-4 TaxID=2876627 RepID=UPI001CCC96DB|nr:hypothetical protein [Mesorhizobium sp. ES1-4]MBZ9796261.1 hypothetical protein [Mesorhizobium sp. ES1-4]